MVSNPQTSKTSKVLDQIKLWLFPAVVTLLAGIIYKEVLEIRADVKMLLAQSNIDKTEIQNLKRDVQMLEQAVFNKKITVSVTHEVDNTELPLFAKLYFKPEEEFDIKKYITLN